MGERASFLNVAPPVDLRDETVHFSASMLTD